ncbi:MAG: heavy-metal-associated domain-containing protein [Brevinematales bacterium]|nr:heavy-metal-associated domain-containing protein [Brevinematales bacterium]
MKQKVKIDGMSCMHCVKAVQEALSAVKGISDIAVKIGEAEFTTGDGFDMNTVRTAIEEAGYEVVS